MSNPVFNKIRQNSPRHKSCRGMNGVFCFEKPVVVEKCETFFQMKIPRSLLRGRFIAQSDQIKPKALARDLVLWYEKNHRRLPWRRTRDPYRIWVSEAMLQQTTVSAVIPYYERWVRLFPTVRDVARATLPRILTAWQGLGYYARARNLHKSARLIVERHAGKVPDDPLVLRNLPGFGAYTVGAVLSIAYDRRLPIVDANVRRVISRLLALRISERASVDRRIHVFLGGVLPQEGVGTFNQALMELGALVCQVRDPLCPICPWKTLCRAHRLGIENDIPRVFKKKIQKIRAVVGLIRKGDALFMQKRPSTGLLANFWEFPGGKIENRESERKALARELTEELGVALKSARPLVTVRHAYTNFSVELSAWACRVEPEPAVDARRRWIASTSLKKYPMASGTVKILEAL